MTTSRGEANAVRLAAGMATHHLSRLLIQATGNGPMKAITAALTAALFAIVITPQSLASDQKAQLSDRQLALMMFVDDGRNYGYQTMLAAIQIDTVKAELERDEKLLKQKQELFRKNAIPPIELEIAQLKDTWNRKQLIVAEKSLATVAAQYEAMKEMAKHFAGAKIPVEALYAIFRRAWEAGCDKGPDEVAVMKAWADFSQKALDRSRQLNSEGNESLASLLAKEAQLKIARSNYEQREARLDRCRQVLFPSLDDIMAVAR